MSVIPVLLGLAAAVGVWLVATGVRGTRAGAGDSLGRQGLARQELGLGQSAIALALEKPLGERLTAPIRRWLSRQMKRLTPAGQAASFQRQLDFAGTPLGLDPAGVQTIRIAASAALGTIGLGLGVLIGSTVAMVIFVVLGLALGFYLPIAWLNQLVRERRAEIEAALPNALDVIAISMEAGLGLDRAMEQLVRHQEGPLTLLLARALPEIELGRPRADALDEMGA